MFIYPYKNGSKSVSNLREAVEGLKVIRRENSRFRGNENKIVINWGATRLPEEVMKATVINRPEAVEIASNKLKFFETVAGKVSIPEYTSDMEVALGWIKEGKTVFARETLKGNSGAGIVILENEAQFEEYEHDEAKIYVKYIPKKDEYRIHVSGGKVIDVQRKALSRNVAAAEANFKVRNHDNGFVFVREGVEPPEKVIEEAIKSVDICGLDFGAVDVIWNNHRESAYVLEVNTAPGLEGSSIETYKKNIFENLVIEANMPAQRRIRGLELNRFNIMDEAVAVDGGEF